MTKISDLTALTGAGVDTAVDILPIVDMSAAGAARNKKITIDEAKIALDVPAAITELDDVPDVNAAAPLNGDVLTWDSTPGEWVPTAPTTGATTLDGLTDVNAPTPADGDFLVWDATPGEWIPGTPAGGVTDLDDLSDVDLTGAATGDVLTKDAGGDWVPQAPAGAGLVLLEQHTASASASLDFTTFISATYDTYQFEIVDIVLATDNVDFLFRMSTDGGSTYAAGASDYAYQRTQTGGANFHSAVADQTETSVSLMQGIDNASTNSTNGTLKLYAPSQTSRHKTVTFQVTSLNNDTNMYNQIGSGRYKNTAAVNAARFIASSGNITSGTIRVYGIVK